jgi:hypothetical protein
MHPLCVRACRTLTCTGCTKDESRLTCQCAPSTHAHAHKTPCALTHTAHQTPRASSMHTFEGSTHILGGSICVCRGFNVCVRGIKLSSFKLQDMHVEVSHPHIRGSTPMHSRVQCSTTPTESRLQHSMPVCLSLVHTHRPRSRVQCSMLNACTCSMLNTCTCSMVQCTARAYGCRMNVQTLELVVVASYNT